MRSINSISARKWFVITLFNLLLVGVFGLLLRLNFLFPVSWIDPKNIIHAHSHFAFTAWVSQALMIFLVMAVKRIPSSQSLPQSYQPIILANWIISIGMLCSFSAGGYQLSSIILSFLATLISYWFCFLLWRDLKFSSLPRAILILIKAALFFNVFSSLGTYVLAYLKASHQVDPLKQLASIYFYLHFQYNGWFFLGCLALLTSWIFENSGQSPISKRFSRCYLFTVLPTYFLSILWWKGLPSWSSMLLLLAAVVQLALWLKLLHTSRRIKRAHPSFVLKKQTRIIWRWVLLAVFLKLILQVLPLLPSLRPLSYGFRPIAIAYLHLVLLVIISLFILAYAFQISALYLKKTTCFGIYSLLFSVFLNEFILMLQGISGFIPYPIPATHQTLAIAALLIVLSLGQLLYIQFRRS